MKYNEKLSKGSGGMQQTRASRVNPMILSCYIDFETAQLSHEFCTPSNRKEHFGEV